MKLIIELIAISGRVLFFRCYGFELLFSDKIYDGLRRVMVDGMAVSCLLLIVARAFFNGIRTISVELKIHRWVLRRGSHGAKKSTIFLATFSAIFLATATTYIDEIEMLCAEILHRQVLDLRSSKIFCETKNCKKTFRKK